MTGRDLNSEGVLTRPQQSIKMDLKTLQNAIDKNVEINQGDLALDKAKQRLPSLIAARNTAMLNKAHPLEVYEAPPDKEDDAATKALSPEEMMNLMTPEQLESILK